MRTVNQFSLLFCYRLSTAQPSAQQNVFVKLTFKDIEIIGDSSKSGLTFSNLWKYLPDNSLALR